jgi:hypothetical protein
VTAWHLEARKYDQRLHYRMPVHLIEDDGERLWLHASPGTPIDHVTRGIKYAGQHASDMFFWRDRWYNIFVNRHPGGALEAWLSTGRAPRRVGSRVGRDQPVAGAPSPV